MATIKLNLQYPDELQADLIAAFRYKYGKNDADPENIIDWTPAELLGFYREGVLRGLANDYRRYKRKMAQAAIQDEDLGGSVTEDAV